jgi:hypothetical protein
MKIQYQPNSPTVTYDGLDISDEFNLVYQSRYIAELRKLNKRLTTLFAVDAVTCGIIDAVLTEYIAAAEKKQSSLFKKLMPPEKLSFTNVTGKKKPQ